MQRCRRLCNGPFSIYGFLRGFLPREPAAISDRLYLSEKDRTRERERETSHDKDRTSDFLNFSAALMTAPELLNLPQ